MTHDATLILPVTQLGYEYMTASYTSDETLSQIAIAAYSDSFVQVHLPRQGNVTTADLRFCMMLSSRLQSLNGAFYICSCFFGSYFCKLGIVFVVAKN